MFQMQDSVLLSPKGRSRWGNQDGGTAKNPVRGTIILVNVSRNVENFAYMARWDHGSSYYYNLQDLERAMPQFENEGVLRAHGFLCD